MSIPSLQNGIWEKKPLLRKETPTKQRPDSACSQKSLSVIQPKLKKLDTRADMLLSLQEEPGVQQAEHQATSLAPPSQQSALQPPTTQGGSRGDVSELSLNAARLYPGQLVSLPGKAGSGYKKHRRDAGSILERRGRGWGGPAL